MTEAAPSGSLQTEANLLREADSRAEGSLFRKSSARLASDVFQLIMATIVGVITARLLGPSGKGTLATLTFLGLIGASIAGAGLGAAAVVRVGQRAIALRSAIGATIAGVAVTSFLAAIAAFLAGLAIFVGKWDAVAVPLVIVAASLPIVAYFDAFQQLLYAREHIVACSVAVAASALVIALCTFVFVGPLGWGMTGAVTAAALGSLAGAIACGAVLLRHGHRLTPRWHREHIRWALGYGAKTQSAYVAGTLAARFDLVLVFAMAGSRQAGFYSVALTIGTLIGTVAWAVSAGTFPRVASLPNWEARDLIVTICRLGLLATIGSAIVLALVTPLLLPIVYGHVFVPAVAPALILIVGGIPTALQALLSRAAAARGDPRILLRSTLVSLAVMIVGDLVLIPPFGIVGAAIAAGVGSVAGLLVALYWQPAQQFDYPPLRELVPRAADIRTAAGLVARSWASVNHLVKHHQRQDREERPDTRPESS